MLDQRQRRWADVVQMLYKCFAFAEIVRKYIQKQDTLNQCSFNVGSTSQMMAQQKKIIGK